MCDLMPTDGFARSRDDILKPINGAVFDWREVLPTLHDAKERHDVEHCVAPSCELLLTDTGRITFRHPSLVRLKAALDCIVNRPNFRH